MYNSTMYNSKAYNARAKVHEGGSFASIAISAQGEGIKYTQGSAGAVVAVVAQATGAKHTAGSSQTGIVVTMQSGGMAIFNGASEVVATVIAVRGAGGKWGIGSAESVVFIAAQGSGTKATQGGSETITVISAEGKFAISTIKFIPLGTFWSGDWDAPEDDICVTTTGRDRLEVLRQSTYSTSEVLRNIDFYELAEIVLVDAGLSSDEYFIDPILNRLRVPYAWLEPQSHREALRKIAEASLGQAYCDREGKIRIEGPSFLEQQTEAVATITQDDYFSKRSPTHQIANFVEVETQPLRLTDREEVYRSNEPVSIGAGQTKTITAYYNHTPCMYGTAGIDGTGMIINTVFYAWGATLTVHSDTAGEFELYITARPLKVLNKEKAIAKNESSIIDNGEIRFVFPKNPLVQNLAIAQEIADTLLQYFSNAKRDVSLDWRGNPALSLGDMVAIADRQETAEYYITKQEIEYNGALRVQTDGRRA